MALEDVALWEGQPVVSVVARATATLRKTPSISSTSTTSHFPTSSPSRTRSGLGRPQLHATVPGNVVVESTVRAGEPGPTAGRRGRDRRGHVPHQPGERGADRDARRDRALGGGHEHARAVGLHADAAPAAGSARALPAHGRDGRARDRPGRGRRLRPQDRRLPRGHHRRPRRHRHAAPGEVDRGPHGILPRRLPRARGRARADPRGRRRRRAARAARPLPRSTSAPTTGRSGRRC